MDIPENTWSFNRPVPILGMRQVAVSVVSVFRMGQIITLQVLLAQPPHMIALATNSICIWIGEPTSKKPKSSRSIWQSGTTHSESEVLLFVCGFQRSDLGI